jgi:hypothetical protein
VVLLPFESRVLTGGDFDSAMKSVPLGSRVVFFPEFLDIVRFPDLRHEEAVVQYLRSKYAAQKVDVVLAAGFAGLNFAINCPRGRYTRWTGFAQHGSAGQAGSRKHRRDEPAG